jgi:hypothetical protein
MKWCELFQCWCNDVDEVVDEEAMQYCTGFSCDDCENAVDVKGGV